MYFFFFISTATTEIYTLSLHDALPISPLLGPRGAGPHAHRNAMMLARYMISPRRSEEHTSELQSRPHLVCRLLLEKKKILQQPKYIYSIILDKHQHHALFLLILLPHQQ